ncbi:MAG: hypothetical protein ACO27Q_10715 [Bacteroidia bacterium]
MVYTYKNHNSEDEMLTFLYAAKDRTKDKHILWFCRCDCGNENFYMATRIRNKTIVLCKKCSRLEGIIKNTKHGMKNTNTYSSWRAMKQRCINENAKDFVCYGGKNINICNEWINSFEAFYHDMGERPKGTSIDRINNKLGYFKENCRWATKSIQARNKNTSYFCEINGIIYDSLIDAATAFKVKKQTISKWVNGWFDKRRNKQWGVRDGCKRIPKY